MLPPQILGRIAAIQAELAGILAALPFTAQPPYAQAPAAATAPVATAPVATAPAAPAPVATAKVAPAVEPAPAEPEEEPTAPEPAAEPIAAAPPAIQAPAPAPAPARAIAPPAKATAQAEKAPEARWSFLPDARYRVVGENPFQPGANATRFDAIVAKYGAEPFSFAELEALLQGIPGDAPSSKAIVAMLQVAGRQRAKIVMAD